MTIQSIDITTITGKQFNVVLLPNGTRYGLNDCLTVTDGALVDFQIYPQGSIAAGGNSHSCGFRYYVRTIAKDLDEYRGLCVQGDAREYDIDAATMSIVRNWLFNQVSNNALVIDRAPASIDGEVIA